MKKIEMIIECPACKGTGVYSGMAESKDIAVICYNCKGTGKYKYTYSYNEFTGRKLKKGIKRVYKKGTQYKLGLGKIDFKGIGTIDMNKEGISYQEFLEGKMPGHIKSLECPMMADQDSCHKINGFVDKCNELGLSWGRLISDCYNYSNKAKCWERFEKGEKE